jgi:hypothetical protein
MDYKHNKALLVYELSTSKTLFQIRQTTNVR